MDFTDKTVLITGGSRGVGRATALAFAKAGARVAVNFHRNTEAATQTWELLEGDDHLIVRADIGNPDATRRMIDAVVAEFGRLDVVVNNAGVFYPHPIDKVDYKTWQAAWKETIDVNLIGPSNVCYCAARQMIEQGHGRIVNISSRGAFRGEPEHPAYGASKAGLNALSQSLAKKLAPHNIYVFAVAPGFIATDMARKVLEGKTGDAIRAQSPLNRVAEPEEIAHAVLFFASEKAAWSTGAILDLNGASYLRT